MKKRIHKFPFLILFMIHSVFLLFAFYKNRDRKTLFISLLSNISFAYLFEYFVLNLFQGYRYKPRILKKNYPDNILGAILSQAIFVPFTAIFITAFQLGWKIKIAFGIYFGLIENLFIRLKIYKHYWWKTMYTVILIPCYFYISDQWYKYIKNGTPIVLFISLFNCIMVTGVNILFIMANLRKFRFGLGEYYSWKEHFRIAPLYSIILSLFTTVVIKEKGWISRIKVFIFAKVLDLFIKKNKLVKDNFHNHIENISIHIFIIYLSVLYKKWINEYKEPRGQVTGLSKTS